MYLKKNVIGLLGPQDEFSIDALRGPIKIEWRNFFIGFGNVISSLNIFYIT